MGDSILGIPVPGAPPGNPGLLESGQPIWNAMGQALTDAVNSYARAASGLDWQSAGATAFHDNLGHLTSIVGRDADNYHQFGNKLSEVGNRISEAQTVYNVSIAAATAAAAIGLGATLFTFGASDAAAAAEVGVDIAAITTEETALQVFINAVRVAIEEIIQNFLRNFITQFVINVVAQEASSVIGGHGLVVPNVESAVVYATAFSLIPGGGLAKTIIGSEIADAVSQEILTGHVNPTEVAATGILAGTFHFAPNVVGSLRDAFSGDPATIGDLNALVDQAKAAGIKTGGDAFQLSPADSQAVADQTNSILDTASANVPAIRGEIQGIATDTGGSIPQTLMPDGTLQYETKGADSLTRKISTDVAINGMTPAESAAQIKDAVRYTIVYPTETYAQSAEQAFATLRADGYTPVGSGPKVIWKNGSTYTGINSSWQSPSGQVFELQIHTPDSFGLKMSTHDAYDFMRVLPAGNPIRTQMESIARQLNNTVPRPPNVRSLGKLIGY